MGGEDGFQQGGPRPRKPHQEPWIGRQPIGPRGLPGGGRRSPKAWSSQGSEACETGSGWRRAKATPASWWAWASAAITASTSPAASSALACSKRSCGPISQESSRPAPSASTCAASAWRPLRRITRPSANAFIASSGAVATGASSSRRSACSTWLRRSSSSASCKARLHCLRGFIQHLPVQRQRARPHRPGRATRPVPAAAPGPARPDGNARCKERSRQSAPVRPGIGPRQDSCLSPAAPAAMPVTTGPAPAADVRTHVRQAQPQQQRNAAGAQEGGMRPFGITTVKAGIAQVEPVRGLTGLESGQLHDGLPRLVRTVLASRLIASSCQASGRAPFLRRVHRGPAARPAPAGRCAASVRRIGDLRARRLP